ncbi:hypothetical protein [Natrinema sp. SYSU A 869]|uniref:hypothetical protein n=1 Tax=Natrinema sp. SYSU A 869 TaxID=2871694 RepID=UPI001CA414D6|nr:hypothetical protein [Natrinema sp. SYSU A 869]
MLSRENRVILGSFLLAAVAFAGVVVAESRFGITVNDYSVLEFFLFPGLFVCLPQLYLAKTDATVSPRSRVRFAVVVTMLFAVAFAGDAGQLQEKLILAIGGGAFLGLVGYEFVAGYRRSVTGMEKSQTDPGR